MTVVYGEPVEYDSYEELASWNQCMRNCYQQQDCVLVYLASPSSSCLLFRFGNIKSINKLTSSSSKIVAFRTSLSSSTCPDSSDSALNSQSTYTSGQSFYNSTITSSTSSYLITYSTITCPINSKLFVRNTTVVCFTVRFFPNFACAVQPNASALCGESGGMSLTGPLNATEYTLFYSWTLETNLQESGVPALKISNGALFWMDGNSKYTAGDYLFEDSTHNGYSGYPLVANAIKSSSPGYCFYYPYLVNNPRNTDTYGCTSGAAGVSTDNIRMTVVYGEPVEYDSYEELASWNQCMRDCYQQQDCVLVYLASPTSSCLLFRFGNIKSINKLTSSSSKIVAFRTSLSSSTCPDSSDSALNSQSTYTSGQSFYNSTITTSTSSYLITYSTITCPINSKLFVRNTTVVCFAVRFFPNFACAVQPNASALCGESGGMSLTGPASQEEYDYLTTLITKDSVAKAGCSTCSSYANLFIWIDGKTETVPKQFIFEDPTHNGYSNYPLYPDTPRGTRIGYCFYMLNAIDDYPCDLQATGGCFVGGACRIKPV